MKKFDMCLAYGFYTDCFLVQERFASNNALCLSVWNEEDGPICTVNVNTDGVPDGAIAVKTWSENEGMEKAMQSIGLIGPVPVGYAMYACDAPIYIVDDDVLEEYSIPMATLMATMENKA